MPLSSTPFPQPSPAKVDDQSPVCSCTGPYMRSQGPGVGPSLQNQMGVSPSPHHHMSGSPQRQPPQSGRQNPRDRTGPLMRPNQHSGRHSFLLAPHKECGWLHCHRANNMLIVCSTMSKCCLTVIVAVTVATNWLSTVSRTCLTLKLLHYMAASAILGIVVTQCCGPLLGTH